MVSVCMFLNRVLLYPCHGIMGLVSAIENK